MNCWLASELGQSCHLALASGEQLVVVARVESPNELGFSVRVGYRRRWSAIFTQKNAAPDLAAMLIVS